MKNLVVLALVAVVAVEAMPQVVEGNALTPSAAVPQTPGMILTAAQGTIPTQLVQIASPLFQGAPATAGPGQAAPQLFSLTPVMIHQLSEAEQNALAHREFLKIWEAQAIRNQAIPIAPADPALAIAPAPAPAPAPTSETFSLTVETDPAADSAPAASSDPIAVV
ncbi:angiomotin-like [Penaeus chinensis]|uniref:angiomotin-like n=1 Tax=Penaeus chinensis TaxID=139456 RepID=UPI001FB7F973|nr:angiomotin-like [Penaeus chinensis]